MGKRHSRGVGKGLIWIGLGHPPGGSLEVVPCLLKGHIRRKPPQPPEGMVGSSLVSPDLEWDPKVSLELGKSDVGRQNPHDGVRVAVEDQGPPQHLPVGSELLFPEVVSQDHGPGRPQPFFLRKETPSELGMQSQDGGQIHTPPNPDPPLRVFSEGYIHPRACVYRHLHKPGGFP